MFCFRVRKDDIDKIIYFLLSFLLFTSSAVAISGQLECHWRDMVKCAVPLCRSGYAPTKTEKASGTVQRNVSVFTFPKNRELRARWVSAIRRSDSTWDPEHCGVCEMHFRKDSFRQETRRNGQRKRKFLIKGSVPAVFDTHQQ